MITLRHAVISHSDVYTSMTACGRRMDSKELYLARHKPPCKKCIEAINAMKARLSELERLRGILLNPSLGWVGSEKPPLDYMPEELCKKVNPLT